MANSDEIHALDDEAPAAAGTVDELRQENGDGSVTLTLKYPVRAQFKRDGIEREENINELRIRRANGGDLRMVMRLQKDEEKVIVELFKRLTGQPEAVFDKLDADDITRFSEEVERFLPQPPVTGTKS